MKLECLQENLAEGLAVVGRVVPTKSTLPVLSNVLLSAADGDLRLAATNLEMAVSHRVPGTVATDGEITLPARLLSDYVALLDHGQKVTLDVDSFPDHTFKGTVQSISPGTGAQFSILPAQNASGNWVKIVQRVPVRIAFDKDEDTHLLRAGMSVNVSIDTQHGRTLAGLLGLTSAAREVR